MKNLEKNTRFPWLAVAGVLGFAGVALGAFGAHGLEETLAERGSTGTWETAVLYLLVHAVAILAVGVNSAQAPRLCRIAAGCWFAGVLLFSGSLFWLALGGPGWLGPVTPLGGLSFLAGWGMVFAQGLRPGR